MSTGISGRCGYFFGAGFSTGIHLRSACDQVMLGAPFIFNEQNIDGFDF